MILLAIDRLLHRFHRGYRRSLLGILVLAAVQTALVVLRPLPIKFLVETPVAGSWLDRLHQWAGGANGYLVVFAVMILSIEAAILLFRLANEFMSTHLSETFIRRFRAEIAGNLLQGRYEAVARFGVGRVLAAVTGDVEVIQHLIKDVAVAATIAAFQLMLMLGVVLVLQPTLFFILLVEIALLTVMIQIYANWRKAVYLAQMDNKAKYLGWISSVYQKNLDLRFSPARPFFLGKTVEAGKLMFQVGVRLWRTQSLYFGLTEFFIGIASAACLVYLVLASQQGARPLGDLLVFLYYTVLVFPCLSRLGEAVPLLTDARNAHDRLAPLLGLATAPSPAPVVAGPFGRIEFRDVGFRGEQGEWILRHLNFVIEPGQQVALSGESGTGKSTILSFILGLAVPDEGDVLINDRSARTLSLAERKRCFLFQRSQAPLFAGSVADNIALGHDFSPEVSARTLADIRLTRRLAASGEGLEMMIGERGEPFSQGEQQRLAIARVFLTSQPCVILDEALNSLDEDTEIAVVDALLHRLVGHTVILITHRRSVAERTPWLFELRRGGALTIRPPVGALPPIGKAESAE